jgi:hypothetical protein
MLTRVVRTAAATLDHTWYVDETPTTSTTTVTVSITDANGAVVTSGNATGAGTGRYTFTLPPQALVNVLTVTWSGTISGAAVTETDTVEIVGARLFSLPEGRASDPSLSDTGKYTTAFLAEKLLEVEEEAEEICDRSFFTRYGRVVLDGSGNPDILLPDHDITTIRAARIATRPGQTFVPLTSTELAALRVEDGVLTRTDNQSWTMGMSNVIVECEFGLTAVPADFKRAALTRFRSRLNLTRSGIPERAISYSNPDGSTYRLDLPGAWKTGIPDVDAVYSRYSLRSGAGTGDNGLLKPASRSLNFDPQQWSLFHSGRR